ncbi:MAG: acyl-CoA dehydrogenase family protein [Acidimicrobiales bacterium]
MDLELTDDQRLLVDTATRFIEHELPMTTVRALIGDPTGYSRQVLEKAGELGWFALLVPEELCGGSVSGRGLCDAALLAELQGRHVVPGPFLTMNVVADALARWGTKEQQTEVLPTIVAGQAVATWAVADDHGTTWNGSGVRAVADAGGFRLEGTSGFVQDAASADWLLVSARDDGSTSQFLLPRDTPGMAVVPLQTFDLGRRMAKVCFDGVIAPEHTLVGDAATAAAAVDHQLSIALALQCAETAGLIDALFSMTVQYAKDRIAFGRPIGSFQALKHVMADQAVFVETCMAGAVAATRAVQDDTTDVGEVTSMVKAYVGDVAVDVTQECLQVHGGIGYTWEHDLHLFLRRVSSNAALYGTPAWHRERICSIYGI